MRTAGGVIDTVSVSGGFAGLFGAWTELIASTTQDAMGVLIWHGSTSTTATISNTTLELGVGAAAAEELIVPGIGIGNKRSNLAGGFDCPIFIPVFIPAGSRIVARIAGVEAGTKVVAVALDTWSCAPEPCPYPQGKIDALGWGGAGAQGGAIMMTGTSGAYPGVTEVLAATDFDYAALMVFIQSNDTTIQNATYRLRLHTGAGGSEQVWWDHVLFSSSASELFTPKQHALLLLPSPLPAGTRISAEVSSSHGTADSIRVHLIGWRA